MPVTIPGSNPERAFVAPTNRKGADNLPPYYHIPMLLLCHLLSLPFVETVVDKVEKDGDKT